MYISFVYTIQSIFFYSIVMHSKKGRGTRKITIRIHKRGGQVLHPRIQKHLGLRRHRRGRGFWGDFANGFKKGFTTTMDIGNQLLPLAKMLI